MRKQFWGILMFLLLQCGIGHTAQKVIFETDFGPDVDDIAALGMLHALMDSGEIELIAVMHNSSEDKGVAAIDAANTYYGRPNIPIGKYSDNDLPWDGNWGYSWWRDIGNDTATYGHNVTGRGQVPDAVTLYKNILAGVPDDSVIIVSVGHLTNIDRLLKDSVGHSLATSKVSEMVVMGGGFPSRCGEANLTRGSSPGNARVRASTTYVMENWAKPLVFSGFEIGLAVRCGEGLKSAPANNPVREAYRLHHTIFTGKTDWDWATFDQTAVLYGARGRGPSNSYWDIRTNGTVNFDGNCTSWNGSINSNDSYITKKMDLIQLSNIIEGLMAHERIELISTGTQINFSYFDQSNYSGKSGSGSATLSGEGSVLTLIGDKWQRFEFPYTVTGNTVMEVTLSASNVGERILVGLDNDNNASTGTTLFQIAGTSPTAGTVVVTPAYIADGDPITYLIPIGESFTGEMTDLVLVAGDQAASNANARFSSIKVYERRSSDLEVIASEDFIAENQWNGGTGWSSGEWLRTGTSFIVSSVAASGSYSAQIKNPGSSLTREVDLSRHSNIELQVSIKLLGLAAGDFAALQFFDGVKWNDLQIFSVNRGFDTYKYDLSRYNIVGSNQKIRLKGTLTDNADFVYIDNIFIRGLSADAYEPNDSVSAAYDLSSNENMWLSSLAGKPRQKEDDWYKIVVSSGSTSLRVECEFVDSHGNMELELYQLVAEPSASQRSIRLVARSASSTNNEVIDFAVGTPGIYFIRAYGIDQPDYRERGNLENDYNLRWNDGLSDPSGDAVFLANSWTFAPGGKELPPRYSELQGNADGDAFEDWAEFALALPQGYQETGILASGVEKISGETYLVTEFTRSKAAPLLGYGFTVEESENLVFPGTPAVYVRSFDLGEGREKVIFRSALPINARPRCFLRLVLTPPSKDY